ncbi:MAG: SPFH domain-containing protein, partial [Phycisphaerae bacterium]|nr:SPFH domain-containing protein [Phycisphaerae bacterium]
LRDIAEQQTNLLMLSGDVDHWIGAGRVGAAAILKQRIQQAADEASLGLVVQQVSIASIHPPQEVAKDFHAVVVAEQERQTSIEYARRQSVQILAETAGSMGLAQKLEQAIDAYRRLADAKASADQLDVAQRAIDLLLDRAGGKAAVEIAEARGYRWVKENDERGKADRFEYELQAYRRAPQLYAQRRYLQVLGEGLAKARVFLLAADRGRLEIRGDFTEISSGFGAVLEESARKESGDDDK